ncbi:uncharacterized protein A1O9_08621 [Exophiala aquamarina CBS 119918]|uniref:HMG box domain-containing protein n=1 Tax=Exophiala aquamarina CBS 119918 TaxID=1182545 RepID=A0A072P4E4_9EURO|nr:uncharacterized protein A1O9_08621 [Exophiala aquamarina CBS 119918]KEF54969.1 hypothetical protein A1O9_08621 [Exophiala aquamarina CBS 119918]
MKATVEVTLASEGMSQKQLDVIWEMGVASFPINNSKLVLPEVVVSALSKDNVEYLKSRYSGHFNHGASAAWLEPMTNAVHIAPAPAGYSGDSFLRSQLYQGSSSEPLSTDASPEASADPSLDGPDLTEAVPMRLPGKKSKVPRPPNAFILYRQSNHPILKAEMPALTNNQISVILGKQWKAESEEVKDRFRVMAELLKTKHAAENPGYQYAPRKPGEKKRRMTARKSAQLQSTKQQNTLDESLKGTAPHSDLSATAYLGSERATFPSYLESGEYGHLSLVMPTGHSNVQADYDTAMSSRLDLSLNIDFTEAVNSDMIQGGRTITSLNAQQFTTDLIDWDGIFDDVRIIRASTNRTSAEIIGTGLDPQLMALESDLQCFEFQDEFNELLSMLD